MIDPGWIVVGGALVAIAGAIVAISKFMFPPVRPFIKPEPILYAKKGEVVTCTNGHEICELAKDVYVNEPLMAEKFINWKNQEPAKPCDVIAPCNACGEPFIKSAMPYGGIWLHIDGEWRTTREPQKYG